MSREVVECCEHGRMPVISSWGLEHVDRSSVAVILVLFARREQGKGDGDAAEVCRGGRVG